MDKACVGLLGLLQETVEAKRDGAERGELKALLTRAALELVRIRQLARQQVEAVEQAKAATLESRAEVDTADLQLQNLLYEKNYYSREIASCQNFRSKYSEEEVGLIPEEKFRAEAPPRFLEGADDPHKLQLQRLEHEKHLRLELLKDLEKVKQRKAEHNQVVIGKRKRLEELRKQAAALQAGAAPLRELLGLPPPAAERARVAAAAAMLPLPLYVAYHQLQGVREAFGEDVAVEILGSDKEAESWAAASGADAFPEAGEGAAGAARKRRKSMEEKTEAAPAPEYVAHPLSLKLSVGGSGNSGGKPLQMQLLYLPRLEVVTVRPLEPEQQALLAGLYPGDTGAALPNEVRLQLAEGGTFAYDTGRPDRPYLWAQHLAGLDFLPALGPTGAPTEPGSRAAVAEGLVTHRKQQRARELLARLRAAAAAAEPGAAHTASLAPAAVQRAQPVQRVRSWEQAAKERAAAAAKLPGPPAVKAGEQSAASKQEAAARLAAISAAEAARATESDEEGELPSEIS